MTDTLRADVRAAAVAAYAAGLCVLPAADDGSKRPGVPSWKRYQEARPDDAGMLAMFPHEDGPQGLGFVCGAVSGGLELFEFDDPDAFVDFLAIASEAGQDELIARLMRGYAEDTPSGGVHWLYFAEGGARGNTKLAMRGTQVLIETRGEGGWVVVAPSGGTTHATGNPYVLTDGGPASIPTLTDAEREILWALARSMGDTPEAAPEAARPVLVPREAEDERPGDAFNRIATWAEILEPAGWTRLRHAGPVGHWTRPGARHGIKPDATTDGEGYPYFYVFSTSVPDFEPERGYDKLGTYAILHHGGDVQAAIRAIARDERFGGEEDRGPLRNAPPVMVISEPAAVVREDRTTETPAEFAHAFPPEHFVTRWIKYAASQTDAAYEYHEACALVALASGTPGVKAHLTFWPRGLSTNLYAMLMGPSSTSRKSTATAIAEKAIETISPLSVMPDRMSPEAWIEQMGKRGGIASLWVHDEIGKSLGEWGSPGRPQGQQMIGGLLSAYDGKPIRYARHSKRIKGGETVEDMDVVERHHLSILGATTPAVYGTHGIASMAEDGLLPRFAIVMPRTRPPRRAAEEVTAQDTTELGNLCAHLGLVAHWAGQAEDGIPARLDPDALAAWNAYSERCDARAETHPILGRIGAMALKVAMLAACGYMGAVPHGSTLRVRVADVQAGIRVTERWARGAIDFMDELTGGGHSPAEVQAAAIVAFLESQGGTVARRDVMRRFKLSAFDASRIGDTLTERGAIIVGREARNAAKPGKTTDVWQAA